MDELTFLKTRLVGIFDTTSRDFEKSIIDQKTISKRLVEIRRWHDSPAIRVNERSITLDVAEFRKSGQLTSYRNLKHVCFGVTGILDESQLLKHLFSETEKCESRRQLRCFQGLLRSYWVFPLGNTKTSSRAKEGWSNLRSHLAGRLKILEQTQERKPAWFGILLRHENLLGENPCGRYGQALLQGDTSEWESVKHDLAIPSDSWVTEEAVLAPMRTAADLHDAAFKEKLEKLLKVVQRKGGTHVSDNLAIRCVALLVSRYARCTSKPEHAGLLAAAVTIIGNPWIKPQVWAAHVVNEEGRSDENARQMVSGWLKRHFIKEFFGILSDDGVTDQRRLKYWLRFVEEGAINDMWIALGPTASNHPGQQFQNFRRLAQGRWLHLDAGGSPNNNAFIMHIGNSVAVEFGVTGNACYVYSAESQPFRLSSGGWVKLWNLKNRGVGKPYRHSYFWEEKFDTELCPLFRCWPTEQRKRVTQSTAFSPRQQSYSTYNHSPRTSSTIETTEQRARYSTANPQKNDFKNRVLCSDGTCIGVIGPNGLCKTCRKPFFDEKTFEHFITSHSLQVVDSRPKGRALWVLTHRRDQSVNKQLTSWGFQFKSDKGWWKE